MKKYLTVLLCTYLFLVSNISATNTNIIDNTKKLESSVLVEYEPEAETVVTEETEDSTVETSEVEEYVEQTDTYTESYDNYENYDTYETYSINYGTYGRLYVSWYEAALYDYNVYTESSLSLQEIVDNYDSAAYYASHGRLVIADHSTHGFNVLYDLYDGSTAYIKFSDGNSISYRMIRKEFGYNTGPDLVDTAGNSFFDMDSDLIMYTCYGDGIMVTLWVLN